MSQAAAMEHAADRYETPLTPESWGKLGMWIFLAGDAMSFGGLLAGYGALRIAVVGGGCSGLQYKMDLVDGPANRDILVISGGVRVVIDPKSALFVSGSELDWSDDLQSGGFKVKNPNAVVTCSCGESFSA